ncbi:hypothetical protein RDABS01_035799 [Bienertia sinuspersici]
MIKSLEGGNPDLKGKSQRGYGKVVQGLSRRACQVSHTPYKGFEYFQKKKIWKLWKQLKGMIFGALVLSLNLARSGFTILRVQKRSFRECAGEVTPCIPSECVGLRETYFNCKRGQSILIGLLSGWSRASGN